MSVPRLYFTVTVLRSWREEESISSTPWQPATAPSIGRVTARWIALGEAPFHEVTIDSSGNSLSGIASMSRWGTA
jgi:hypothetical protein